MQLSSWGLAAAASQPEAISAKRTATWNGEITSGVIKAENIARRRLVLRTTTVSNSRSGMTRCKCRSRTSKSRYSGSTAVLLYICRAADRESSHMSRPPPPSRPTESLIEIIFIFIIIITYGGVSKGAKMQWHPEGENKAKNGHQAFYPNAHFRSCRMFFEISYIYLTELRRNQLHEESAPQEAARRAAPTKQTHQRSRVN